MEFIHKIRTKFRETVQCRWKLSLNVVFKQTDNFYGRRADVSETTSEEQQQYCNHNRHILLPK